MTAPGDDIMTDGSSAIAHEDVQRRIEELMGRQQQPEETSRRTRVILVAVLILLLLLLLGVGAFLYNMLSPDSGKGTGIEGDDDLAGVTWIRSIYGYGPSAEQQFMNPNDAVTGPDGTIWVTDPGNYRVLGFRADGTYVDQVRGSRDTGEPFRIPSRVAVDSDGIMYIVDRSNSVLTIMDGDRKLASALIPAASAVDVNDEMVVVGSHSGFAILDKDGNAKHVIGSRGNKEDQFDTVSGVAIDSARRLIYVVDTYNNRLSAWDYSGKRQWMVVLGNAGNKVKLQGGASLETSSAAPAALQIPTDVSIDGKGRPIVLDAFDFSISAFDPKNGKFLGKWGTYGQRDGQFMYPSGFSYDASKDWFVVADTENLRAQIIRIKGTADGSAGIMSGLNRLFSGPLRALWPCLGLLPLILLLLLVRAWRRRRAERIVVETVEDPAPAL